MQFTLRLILSNPFSNQSRVEFFSFIYLLNLFNLNFKLTKYDLNFSLEYVS
jgi:hypothetical protein